LTTQEAEERNALAATRADLVATSLRRAVEQVVNAAKEAAGAALEGEVRVPAGAPAMQRRGAIRSWSIKLTRDGVDIA
jgi:hypothetical protein